MSLIQNVWSWTLCYIVYLQAYKYIWELYVYLDLERAFIPSASLPSNIRTKNRTYSSHI